MYYDNSPDDEVGLDAEQMKELVFLLVNTKRNLRAVVEDHFGWECSQEILVEVLQSVDECNGCRHWVPVDQAGTPECMMCAELARPMTAITNQDLEWLAEIKVKL